MIPWPIALLAVFYIILATSSAASAWRILQGWDRHAPWWPLLWSAAAGVVALGLALMKPWARAMAVWLSVFLVVGSLGSAWLAASSAHPDPIRSLVATLIAGAHLVVVRYLTRPRVKAWFVVTEQR